MIVYYLGVKHIRSTEKVFKQMDKYIEQHRAELKSPEDYERLVKQFMDEYNASIKSGKPMEKAADDYLDMADEAETLQKHVEYLNKALSLEPDNVDAKLALILVRMEEEPEEKLSALATLLGEAAKPLLEGGYFENHRGDFWGYHETRPFMRVKQEYLETLINNGMITLASGEGKEMLALNKNDNLGIRFTLMHLYAYMEDEKAALKLHKKFENSDETQMLLPLSVLYYKLGQLDKAEEYLRKLSEANRDIKKFLRAAVDNKLENLFEDMDPHGYRPSSAEELGIAIVENQFLYATCPHYFHWANRCLNKKNDSRKPGNITEVKF